MWWLGVPALMVLYDWAKLPIDTLYFQKWRRPLTGIANTFRDVVHAGSQCRVADFPGLMLIRLHFERIRDEFEAVHPTLEKKQVRSSSRQDGNLIAREHLDLRTRDIQPGV